MKLSVVELNEVNILHGFVHAEGMHCDSEVCFIGKEAFADGRYLLKRTLSGILCSHRVQ